MALGAGGTARAEVAAPDLSAYARARAADAEGKAAIAVEGYAAALAAAPSDPVIAMRAYRRALAAGDLKLAFAATFTLVKAQSAPPDAAILLFAGAVQAGDLPTADRAADGLARGPLGFLAPSMKAWVALGRGDADPAAALGGDPAGDNALQRRLSTETRALLLIALGKERDGVAAVQALPEIGGTPSTVRSDAVRLLQCRGELEAAQSLSAGGATVVKLDRREAKACAKFGAAYGAARLLARLAEEFAGGDGRTLAIVLARASLILDPAVDRARLALATALNEDGDTADALAALDGVTPAGAEAAAGLRIDIFQRAGRTDEALAVARAQTVADPGDAEAWQRLGDLLVGQEKFAAAATAYGEAIARSGAAAPWLLYLQQGGASEQAGDWPAAQRLLRQAVEKAPQEPVALNYLGYALIERGEAMAEARALLERAAQLAPDDPSITDSLGWAYFRSGMTAKALPLLERAAQARPSSATINEHLGDAYWAAGRHYEARYAWRAATVFAGGDDAKRLADKIAQGPAPRR